jgi:hypothetical protein
MENSTEQTAKTFIDILSRKDVLTEKDWSTLDRIFVSKTISLDTKLAALRELDSFTLSEEDISKMTYTEEDVNIHRDLVLEQDAARLSRVEILRLVTDTAYHPRG